MTGITDKMYQIKNYLLFCEVKHTLIACSEYQSNSCGM